MDKQELINELDNKIRELKTELAQYEEYLKYLRESEDEHKSKLREEKIITHY